MGQASRRKHEHRLAGGKPRWAGAPGFDRAYRIAESYVNARTDLLRARVAGDAGAEARAQIVTASRVKDVAGRKVATLQQRLREMGQDAPPRPSRQPRAADGETYDFLPYARAFAALADEQLERMRDATPIVFDPLSVPGLSVDAVSGLGLPFPVVVTDFLAPGGMSLPVEKMAGGTGWWVGLVAATVAQGEEGGPVDVWPTITTLEPERDDRDQRVRELMFGRVRFGGPLPSPPDELMAVEGDGWVAWIVTTSTTGTTTDNRGWAEEWAVRPALAAISALRVLEAVNVDLTDVVLSRPERRRAMREDARPALTVDITTGRGHGGGEVASHGTVEWSHRWMVRGHWKHFGEQTAVARRHPSRVRDVPGHGRCVRVWCPPFVKGPAERPLVLKTRVVAHDSAVPR
jgi:hypothetical protein